MGYNYKEMKIKMLISRIVLLLNRNRDLILRRSSRVELLMDCGYNDISMYCSHVGLLIS